MTIYDVLSLVDHLPDPHTGAEVSQRARLSAVVDHAIHCEHLGFAGYNVGEHHFDRYIMPAPELLLAYVAARTSTIRLGTSVSLLANLDPVRFAEQLAVLDVLTGGRVEVTFARGASESTARAFGTESFEELRPKFDESLRLVLRLLAEEQVTWRGEHRTSLEEVRLEPRPLQSPHQLIWVGGGLSTVSADLAAELGLRFMLPSLFRWPEDYSGIVDRYRAGATRAGFGDQIQVGFPSYVHVAETSQLAKRRWRPYLESYRDFAMRLRGSFGRPVDYQSLLEGPAIAGSPSEVVDKINRINEALELDRHLFLVDVGGMPPELVAESTALLAEALELTDGP
ncbi:MAG: LLM class flavin-dependent oxidoreductase [Acidimicrobiia bacterium]|nr:LLM class flavin-dependent oxidoreductase [Acidimicrobiia bacterium]